MIPHNLSLLPSLTALCLYHCILANWPLAVAKALPSWKLMFSSFCWNQIPQYISMANSLIQWHLLWDTILPKIANVCHIPHKLVTLWSLTCFIKTLYFLKHLLLIVIIFYISLLSILPSVKMLVIWDIFLWCALL